MSSSPQASHAYVVDAANRSPFRADIQGLRAIAVGGVVLYHCDSDFLRGGFIGVDIFFVISGFLITNHLLSRLSKTGGLRFGEFYLRRARRVLPAAFVVLIATIIATIIWLPRVLAPDVLWDAVATAFYVPNVRFAVTGTDYLAETAPSPLQHYWSLGVEEQFYLLWPLILLLCWKAVRGRGVPLTTIVATVVSVSALLSILLTFRSQPWAFFSLPTRAWELGAGGLVALLSPAILKRVPRTASLIVGWAGLAGIVTSMVAIDGSLPFPGVIAIVPVVSAALVICFGSLDDSRGPSVVLGRLPFQFLGRISYSVYLVHWPLLVIPALASIDGRIPVASRVVLATLSAAVGWLLFVLVERPAQRSLWIDRRRSRSVLSAALALSVVVGGSAAASATTISQTPLSVSRAAVEVAPQRRPSFTSFVPQNLTPSLATADEDIPVTYSDGCHLAQTAETIPDCSYGDLQSSEVIALFGDSHAAQWFPALEQIARDEELRLDVYTRSSCPSVQITLVTDGVPDLRCNAWRSAIVERLNSAPPDRIVMANFSRYQDFGASPISIAEWSAGLTATLTALPVKSIVSVVSDTPEFEVTPAVCLSARLADALKCSRPREDAISAEWIEAEAVAAERAGAGVVAIDDYLCDEASCGLIIGSDLVYRDRHHLTASYAQRLSSPLWNRLVAASPADAH